MKTILLMTAALLLATPAGAGDDGMCYGEVFVGEGQLHIGDVTETSARPCFTDSKPIISYILKVCPKGTDCTADLGTHGRGYRQLQCGSIGSTCYKILKRPVSVERSER